MACRHWPQRSSGIGSAGVVHRPEGDRYGRDFLYPVESSETLQKPALEQDDANVVDSAACVDLRDVNTDAQVACDEQALGRHLYGNDVKVFTSNFAKHTVAWLGGVVVAVVCDFCVRSMVGNHPSDCRKAALHATH